MGQDRKWDKDRERARKAAYRERQKQISQAEQEKQGTPSLEERLAPLGLKSSSTERQRSDAAARMMRRDPQEYWDETHRQLPVGAPPLPSLTEEQYVQAELSITRQQLAAGLKDPDGHTLERSERYLRWRYKGFVAGEIASL